MSSTAEGLASQADQLQDTISFFRIGGSSQNRKNTSYQEPDRVGVDSFARKTSMSTETEKSQGNRKENEHSAIRGYFLEMKESQVSGDRKDEEFESY